MHFEQGELVVDEKYPFAQILHVVEFVMHVLQVGSHIVQELSAPAKYPSAQIHFVVLSEHVKQDLSHREQAASLGK